MHVSPSSKDYVLSFIAFQHMVTELQVVYMEQMCDVLRRGGLGYIQVPTRLREEEGHCGHLDAAFAKTFAGGMQMHYTSLDELTRHLRDRGCSVISADACEMVAGSEHTPAGTMVDPLSISSCILFKKSHSTLQLSPPDG